MTHFHRYVSVSAINELCAQLLNVAIGWQVYAATHNPMSLAYVGLTQFVPNIAMSLIAGHTADCFDRRKITGLSLLAQALCAGTLAGLSTAGSGSVAPVYVLLLLIGIARAFSAPALPPMLPHLVSANEFPRAVAANSSAFQMCTILGPALGGLIYAFSAPALYAFVAVLYLVAVFEISRLRAVNQPTDPRDESGPTDESMLAGVRCVRANRLLLALTSLDLFAVLLGGVTALLPVYARDILRIGPAGLGCLRCAPGIGAAVIGLILAKRTLQGGAGKLMLTAVAGFGLATIVFALSTNFWLSLIALVSLGGFDMVSMVIREALLQISTPDAMRGRVSAVNGVFISASSELGQVESGVTASLLGAVPAAFLGGVGTLAIVALWTWIFPELHRASEPRPKGSRCP